MANIYIDSLITCLRRGHAIVDARDDLLRDDHRLDLEAVAQLADARGDLVKHDWRAGGEKERMREEDGNIE